MNRHTTCWLDEGEGRKDRHLWFNTAHKSDMCKPFHIGGSFRTAILTGVLYNFWDVNICCMISTKRVKSVMQILSNPTITSPSASSKRIHPSIPTDTKLFSHGISQLPQVVLWKVAIAGIRPQDKGGWSCLRVQGKSQPIGKT